MVTDKMRIASGHFSPYFLRSNRCFLTTIFCLIEWGWCNNSFLHTPIASHNLKEKVSYVAVSESAGDDLSDIFKVGDESGSVGGRWSAVGGGRIMRATTTLRHLRNNFVYFNLDIRTLSTCLVPLLSPLWFLHLPSCSGILLVSVVLYVVLLLLFSHWLRFKLLFFDISNFVRMKKTIIYASTLLISYWNSIIGYLNQSQTLNRSWNWNNS